MLDTAGDRNAELADAAKEALATLPGKEIDRGMPAATVAASYDSAAADITQQTFASDRFRVYTNADPIGTELGGTLKNVMAIAVGVCDGLELTGHALVIRNLLRRDVQL